MPLCYLPPAYTGTINLRQFLGHTTLNTRNHQAPVTIFRDFNGKKFKSELVEHVELPLVEGNIAGPSDAVAKAHTPRRHPRRP